MTETLVVIVFVSAIFTFLYISILPLIGTYNDKVVRESDIDIVYKLYHIRKMIYGDGNRKEMIKSDFNEITCDDFSNPTYCNNLMNKLELNNFTLLYVNGIKNNIDKLNVSKYSEIYKVFKNSLDEEEVLIIYDNNKNTYAHLKYEYTALNGDIASEMVLDSIERHQTVNCQNITYIEDGITYFSGSNECINFNYLWYSGKLWRITAIYPDGTMKIVTENNITSISFNERYDINFNGSYAYQWLNEEFYNTLYHAEYFIDKTKLWDATNSNATSLNEISTKLSKTTMVSSNVGLLDSYDLYNSYRCIGNTECNGTNYGQGYLNIKYIWWMLNPYNSTYVWAVIPYGQGVYYETYTMCGIRPSIYLNSSVKFTGSGTLDNPYRIVGDKNEGKANDLLNTRISGEYIKIVSGNNEQIFRIIGIEDNKTKVISMDHANHKSATVFARSTSEIDTLWGRGTTTEPSTWYYYLNNTYFPDMVRTYGNMFDSAIYYLGTSGYNYKLSICNMSSGPTNKCIKTDSRGTYSVGLSRYGEMFATQQGTGYSNSLSMWLINRYSTSEVICIDEAGMGRSHKPNDFCVGRPTLHLKPSVKIKSGIGTYNDPYVVGL